jgi:hypothetical protein
VYEALSYRLRTLRGYEVCQHTTECLKVLVYEALSYRLRTLRGYEVCNIVQYTYRVVS